MMRVCQLTAGAALILTFVIVLSHTRASAQTNACFHDPGFESQGEQARRQMALRLARAINTAEMQVFSSQNKFAALDRLPISVGVPQGFAAALSTDGQSYAFSVKDVLDPCHFAYFSDQNGVIFNGQPIR